MVGATAGSPHPAPLHPHPLSRMLSRSSRPLRALLLVAAFSGAAAVAAAPASAAEAHATAKAKVGHSAKPAKKAKRLAAKADLVARGLQLDFLSDGFDIEAKIANTGTKRSRKSDVTIALSTDLTLDGADDVLQDISIPRVQPGVERSISTEVEIPDDLAEGDLYLLVCADGNLNVKERSESNNCASQLVASDEDLPIDEDDASADSEDDDSASQDSVSDDE